MAKVVITETHGVTIIEGTIIHCYAAFNRAFKGDSNPICAYLYDDAGVLINLNYFEGAHDTLHARFTSEQQKRMETLERV